MPAIVQRGSAHLAARSFFSDDGTALLMSSVAEARVEIYQSKVLLHTYVLGTDDELQQTGDSELTYELTVAVTTALDSGPIVERWVLEIADADFIADSGVWTAVRVISDISMQ